MLNRNEILNEISKINKDKATKNEIVYVYKLLNLTSINENSKMKFNYSYYSETRYIMELSQIRRLLINGNYIDAIMDIYDFFYFFVYNESDKVQKVLIEDLKLTIKEGLNNEVEFTKKD